jgi:cytochrome c-type biogenesis protein CcmF
LRRLSPSYFGMQLAHLGFASAALGVILTSQYAVERDVKMAVGDSYEIAGYHFDFNALERVQGPNFIADEAHFIVSASEGGEVLARLNPQKRRYLASGQVMTEAAIDAGVWRDIFIAMGEPLEDGSWAIRLHYKPFVRWIWGGAIMMAFGGFLTLTDRRYRMARSRSAAAIDGGGLRGAT